jgi:hypothetical protein
VTANVKDRINGWLPTPNETHFGPLIDMVSDCGSILVPTLKLNETSQIGRHQYDKGRRYCDERLQQRHHDGGYNGKPTAAVEPLGSTLMRQYERLAVIHGQLACATSSSNGEGTIEFGRCRERVSCTD